MWLIYCEQSKKSNIVFFLIDDDVKSSHEGF